MMIAQFNFN